jgi:hypothetical protein
MLKTIRNNKIIDIELHVCLTDFPCFSTNINGLNCAFKSPHVNRPAVAYDYVHFKYSML